MDGIEATRQIRQLEKKRGLRRGEGTAKIIALTGLGADTTRAEMLRAGADYYLCKPVRFKELMALFDEDAERQHHREKASA
jgi:CheY-like chemotaxis protein